jgi:hypothetical protein
LRNPNGEAKTPVFLTRNPKGEAKNLPGLEKTILSRADFAKPGRLGWVWGGLGLGD